MRPTLPRGRQAVEDVDVAELAMSRAESRMARRRLDLQ